MYRYGIVITGASYSPGQVTEASHVILAESLRDAQLKLWGASLARNPHGVTGDGKPTLDTPDYGHEGDGALIYRIPVDDPNYAEVIPTDDGAAARHAWAWLTDLGEHTPDPSHIATFGPRGGIVITKAG